MEKLVDKVGFATFSRKGVANLYLIVKEFPSLAVMLILCCKIVLSH